MNLGVYEKTIAKIVAFAAKAAEPEEIILFGSMNDKTHNVHSDIDLLIVTENTLSKNQIVEQIQHFAEELSLKADILVYSKSDILRASAQPNSFLSGISKKGTTLYQKNEKKP